ncbi:MAG: type I DNA topoisomerase [Acholeplasmatales bacterium]|jgi:DNA topoisomerase-1|nr:type I DNA topoisomerase [Acholeplasmatales bacterium]
MEKILLVVESPKKSKTISSYLRGLNDTNIEVVASVGSIRDLDEDTLAVDVDDNFRPTYTIKNNKTADFIKSKALTADKVILATDPDREGEAISWHLATILNLDMNEKNRVTFEEITKDTIIESLENPRIIDQNMFNSQQTRRIIDRLIGYPISTLLQEKIKSKSAGRVQSAVLKIICDREDEIESFNSILHYELTGKYQKYLFQYQKSEPKKLLNFLEASTIKEESKNPFIVREINEEEKYKHSHRAFKTTTLQIASARHFNFSPKKCMDIAQALFQSGYITYMRTESERISNKVGGQYYNYVVSEFGKEYAKPYNSIQVGAHEGIRPSDINKNPYQSDMKLKSDELKLYKLIFDNTVACFMQSPKYLEKNIIVTSNKHDYKLTGIKKLFDGYNIFTKEKIEEKDLPDLKIDEKINFDDIELVKRFTEPKPRFNQGSIIKEMEDKEIGRPSTYASTIQTLLYKSYVTIQKNHIYPTTVGRYTNNYLSVYFPKFVDEKYTKDMEEKLDLVAEGKVDSLEILTPFNKELENAISKAGNAIDCQTHAKCPDCSSLMTITLGKFAAYYKCPNCLYSTSNIELNNDKSEQSSDSQTPNNEFNIEKNREKLEKRENGDITAKCPNCNSDALDVTKNSIKCSSCGFEKTLTDELCPTCGSPLLFRNGRYGVFIGCSNYPKCKYILNVGEKKTFFATKTKSKKRTFTKSKYKKQV